MAAPSTSRKPAGDLLNLHIQDMAKLETAAYITKSCNRVYISVDIIYASIWDASHWDASNWNASHWHAEN